MKRAAIIYNPVRVDLARLRRTVTTWEGKAGWEPSLWLPTSLEGSTSALVDDAMAAGVQLVVAAGGDGTVSETASALRRSEVPLAILPCGTANLLARNLRLPLTSLSAAARIAFTGSERPMDVGVLTYRLVDGSSAIRPFFVMAGFGLDADMVSGTDALTKKRFGWLAYVNPILRSANRRSRAAIDYALDDNAATSARLHSLVVGNCGTVTAGLRLLPTAEIDDGLLDVLAVRSLHGRDRGRFLGWLAPYQGPRKPATEPRPRTDSHGTFRYTTARRVTVELHDPAEFQADGDLLGTVVWAEFGLDPAAITVRVP